MIAIVEVGFVVRVENRAGLESRLGEPRVAETSILGTSLSCAVALLRAENLSELLGVIKTLEEFFCHFRIK